MIFLRAYDRGTINMSQVFNFLAVSWWCTLAQEEWLKFQLHPKEEVINDSSLLLYTYISQCYYYCLLRGHQAFIISVQRDIWICIIVLPACHMFVVYILQYSSSKCAESTWMFTHQKIISPIHHAHVLKSGSGLPYSCLKGLSEVFYVMPETIFEKNMPNMPN